jgi:competence ComEA-like helix-hairpin-helix protein
VSIIKGLFHFSRAETIALLVFVALLCVGGGIRLLQKLTEPSPPEMHIKTLAPDREQRNPVTTGLPVRSAAVGGDLPLQLNINTAPAESLILLPRIGSIMTQRIVEYRDSVGGFDSLGQLLQVRGIGPKTLNRIRPYLVVE